jgi:predicted DNA-binding WGR domain protein
MGHFEFKDGKSSKFWQASQEGAQLTINWGRSGEIGETRTRTFNSPDAAFRNMCTLIGEKLANGYIEITDDGSPMEPFVSQSPYPSDHSTRLYSPFGIMKRMMTRRSG